MDQTLFRKKSIERISSPEQLNDYLHVTSPSVWVILLAVIILLVGVVIWAYATTIESYVEGSGEVKAGVMTIRFSDQSFAKNVETGMSVTAGGSETTVSNVGRDPHGLLFATANTTLADGFYPVRICYRMTQVMRLLFD